MGFASVLSLRSTPPLLTCSRSSGVNFSIASISPAGLYHSLVGSNALNPCGKLNTGGNTYFLNMLDRRRLVSKKRSKTEAVQSQAAIRLKNENIHIGPSDWVPWQKDNKICFIRMEGNIF
ncbi:hypothetical protein LCGC14_2534210, partial [marine sediment metagenome]